MSKRPSMISLNLPKTTLTMPITKFVWMAWCILTYPLAWAFGYYLFGWVGVLWVAGIQVLTFRGKL